MMNWDSKIGREGLSVIQRSDNLTEAGYALNRRRKAETLKDVMPITVEGSNLATYGTLRQW